MTTICITSLPDGTFEVEPQESAGMPEPMGGEMGQPDMAEDAAEGAQTFKSIDEALNAAKQMLSGGAAPMMDGEADFLAQGFNQVRGTPEQQAGRN